MKKIKTRLIVISLIALIGFTGSPVLAQEIEEPVVLDSETLMELPEPGILPGSFWYFLDGWGESIRGFFTFNPERKAILETKRALERIAEINALLEKREVDTPELDVAEEKIERNVARVNEILEREQARGRDVASLAEQLDDKFTDNRKSLNQVFEQRRQAERASIKRVRDQIRRALNAEELAQVPELRSALEGARIQRERLDNRRRKIQDRVLSEREELRRKMSQPAREARILKREKEALADEGERITESLFEEREIAIEAQEEVLEIQLNQAILAEDTVLIEQIHNQLTEVEFQAEVLEIEEEQLEKKIEAEIEEPETAIEIILETRDDIDDLKIMANKARMRAKEAIERAKAKADEQNLDEHPVIAGLIKQAERLHERGLMLFEQEEYKKSYLASRQAIAFARKAFKLINVKENLRRERPDLPIMPMPIPMPFPPPELGPAPGLPNDVIEIPERDGGYIPMPTPIPDTGEISDVEKGDLPGIIDPQETSLERVKKQIKIAEQLIEKTRRVISHEDAEAIVFPVVVKLIGRAENNIDKAEALLKQGVFNSAHRHAIEATSMAKKAYSIIQRKLQTGEIKITPEPTERTIVPLPTDERLPIDRLGCQTDADCIRLVCTMLIGQDTPQCCPERNVCFCGPGRDVE